MMHPLQHHLNAIATHWHRDQPRNLQQLAALASLMEQLPAHVQELLWDSTDMQGNTLRTRWQGQLEHAVQPETQDAWHAALQKAQTQSSADRIAQFMQP